MSLERITGPLPFAEIREVRDRARQFADFVDFQTQSEFGEFEGLKKLPPRQELNGLTFGKEVTIRGELSAKEECVEAFLDLLQRGKAIGALGTLTASCAFEEVSSHQTKRASDSVSLSIRGGRPFFGYRANGSRVSTDAKYGREVLKRLISLVQLPLRIRDLAGGYGLEHTREGELWISQCSGPNNENPTGFRCELADSSWETLLQKTDAFLRVAARRRLAQSWSAAPLPEQADAEKGVGTRVYDLTLAAELPAKEYGLWLDYQLEQVEGIEAIRRLCGKKNEVVSTLCSFGVPEKGRATIQVLTTLPGHRVQLTADRAQDQQLADILNKLELAGATG